MKKHQTDDEVFAGLWRAREGRVRPSSADRHVAAAAAASAAHAQHQLSMMHVVQRLLSAIRSHGRVYVGRRSVGFCHGRR